MDRYVTEQRNDVEPHPAGAIQSCREDLAGLVNMYMHHEARCEELIEAQDKIRLRVLRVHAARFDLATDSYERKSENGEDSSAFRFPNFPEYRRRHLAVNGLLLRGQPYSKKIVAQSIADSDLLDIEDLEAKIDAERSEMSNIEMSIYECPPANANEAIKKMQFLVRIILDGIEMELDFIAYQIDECLTVLAGVHP